MSIGSSILKKQELVLLGLLGLLAVLHLVLWSQVRENPMLSVAMVVAVVIVVGGYWAWKNFKMIKTDPNARKRISVKIENILHSLFLPRGYDIMTLPDIDAERLVGSAELRDNHGIHVLVQYHEWPLDNKVDVEDLEELDNNMVGREIPKGICLATTFFTPAAQEFARRKNILLKNSDELIEMIRRAEEELHATATGEAFRCLTCGTVLIESEEITDLMVCPNPDCGKTFSREELEGGEKEGGRKDLKIITISCYECNRPVQLDTGMHGLMECPYDDCSWIINVDNELLALKGGLDKRSSENLAEIVCPKCDKIIKVPADSRGLIECPCEEKWIIDVGQALGEKAQAQLAERIQTDHLRDCPGCGAGVPTNLDSCPVCGAELPQEAETNRSAQQTTGQPSAEGVTETAAEQSVETEIVGGGTRQMTHRHAYLNLSTGGLVLLVAFSVAAFLAFVYLVVR